MKRKIPKKIPKLTEQVRQAIEDCGKTRYQISQETRIDQATLCRFMGGKGGLSFRLGHVGRIPRVANHNRQA